MMTYRKHYLLATIASATLLPFAAAAQTELTLWHMEQPPHRVERVQMLLDEFNASHPEIQVRQEPQNWGEVYAKAPAALAAGIGPDLLFAIPDFTPVLKDMGALSNISDFVAELDEAHDFIPSAVEAYSYDDGVWAVPLYNMSMNLWYRPSVLEAAGIAVPQTWDDWQAAAAALTGDGSYGMGLPANKQLYTDQTVYSVMVNGDAAEIYNADGTLRFDNPQTVEAYRFYNDMLQYSPPDAPSWTWGEAEACFASQACGMIMQFSVISTYETQAGGDADDLGVAPIPSQSGDEHNAIAYANAVMLLSRDEEKTEASKTFVRWLLQPENYGRFLNMEPGLFMPVTADGAEAESFWSDPIVEKYRSQIETVIDNSQNGMLFGFTSGRVFPAIGAISAQNVLAETLQTVAISGVDPAQAVADGQTRMQQLTE
ncbi:MAG: extracellular solute-binding protein [Loktanella sp.]|nr:extracellular solute-binding protein [Loktanella sp.]